MLTPQHPPIATSSSTADDAHETTTAAGVVVGLVALAASFVAGFLLDKHRVHWLPESAASVAIGVVACALVAMSRNDDVMSLMRFDFDFFMAWLIPPIIFEAAFNMNVSAFFANIWPTLFFAFAGTLISTFVVAGVVFYAGQYGLCYALSPLAALTFGSLISATDPVAVLATFQQLGVSPDLFSLVFGESVLNDAVAIVLTRTLASFAVAEASAVSILGAFSAFLHNFVGSSLIGLGLGALSALTFKHLQLRAHDETVFLEVVLSFPFPWAAYFLAEAVEFSGIVAILFCGLLFATYTRVNVSMPALQLMAGTYKCIAKVAETFVFVYLGMACVRMAKIGLFEGVVWQLSSYGLLGCFLGRAHIFLGAWGANRLRGHPAPWITRPMAVVMWLSGLRGGVAFAIAGRIARENVFPDHCGGLQYDETHATGDTRAAMHDCRHEVVPDDSHAILQMTMLIAVFTTFMLGGAMPTIAARCDLIGAVVGEAGEADEGSVHGAPGAPGVPDGGHSAGGSSENLRASPTLSARREMDNKATPLLIPRDASGPLSEGSPSPLHEGSLVLRRVEESHSWLVRFLTVEENYESMLHEEQQEETDRFIRRGSLDPRHDTPPRAPASAERARGPAELRRWRSSGSIPVKRTILEYEPPRSPGGS